jgi:hypothetical protein
MSLTTVKKSYECKLYYSSIGAANAAGRSGTTTNGSDVITMADTSDLVTGMALSGTGIPSGATIASIVADTSITISANATASATVTVTFGVPWVEISSVKSVTLTSQFDEADVSVRQMQGNKASEPTLVGWSVDFDIPFDEDDDQRVALVTAANARTTMGFAVMSGGILTTGSQGLKADMKVFTQSREEQIQDTVSQKFTIKPCLSDTPPAWLTV